MALSLERIISGNKKFLLASLIAASTLSSSFKAKADEAGFYNYGVQERGIVNKSLDGEIKNGLYDAKTIGFSEDSTIKSIGNYSSKDPDRANDSNKVRIKVYKRDKDLELQYKYLTPENLDPRTPVELINFREDKPNTHVYLVLPKEVFVGGMVQEVISFMHDSKKLRPYLAVPLDETELSRRLADFNKALDVVKGNERNPQDNELKRLLDNFIDILPSKASEITEKFVLTTGLVLEAEEKKRFDALQQRFPEERVIPLPLYQENGLDSANPFNRTNIGRNIHVSIARSNLKVPKKGFVIIPQMTFTKDVSGNTRIVQLENLEYEFVLNPEIAKTKDNPSTK